MKNKMERLVHNTLTKNYNKYYRLAYSYVHNETDAMDIVQEGAYKAILKCNDLKKEAYADTWIYRIMINEALTFIKSHKKEIVAFDEIKSTTTDSYEDIDLKDAVNNLETLDRTIIILRFFEELKLEQIADIVDENLNTVKSRLYRALKKLKVSLEVEEVISYEK